MSEMLLQDKQESRGISNTKTAKLIEIVPGGQIARHIVSQCNASVTKFLVKSSKFGYFNKFIAG